MKDLRTNRLIGSRMTEEMIAETWHHLKGNYIHKNDIVQWLESNEMKGRWCVPASGVAHGIYFEFEEDKMHFWMKWA